MVHSDSSTDLTSLRVNLSECSSASLDMSSDLDMTLAIGSPLSGVTPVLFQPSKRSNARASDGKFWCVDCTGQIEGCEAEKFTISR